MADLTKNIIYRTFTLNDEDIQANFISGNAVGSGISGCVLDSCDYNDVDVVQFMEKRALEPGMDVGDAFKGARRIRISGTLYGTSRADLYDRLDLLREALDPELAQADEPADKGYQPFYFSVPTLNLAIGTGFPSGYSDRRLLAMPRALGYLIQRDNIGGSDDDALALPWQASLICRDPRIMGALPQEYAIDSAPGTVTGTLINRGNHYGVLNMILSVGTGAGTINVQAGTSIFTITLPSSTNARTIRLKGDQKIITVEDDVTHVEVTDMAMISFTGDNTWPQVQKGSHSYSITYTTVTAAAGSQMWFWEPWA